MLMHTIQIDDEVYRYLVSKIKDFEEPVNTVLRREFKLGEGKTNTSNFSNIPQLSPSTPKALKQILQVVYLIRSEKENRSKATHRVAVLHQVAPQTIIDKYTRQLGKTAREFDDLVGSDLSQFRAFLNEKFPGYGDLINQYVL